MRTYAAMTTLVRQKLQSSATAEYSVAEVNDHIQDALQELALYRPHVVPVVFEIESRYGTASSTSTDNLVDTDKGQFLSTDPTNEKVVHNTTDNTWAVILSFSSTAQVGLSADIFAADEQYRLYNKYCWNQKQIYIGDMPGNYRVESVEYPIGQRRNFQILDNVLEIDVDTVADSNAGSTITELPDVDVLVRFSKPHALSQLTDWVGRPSATAAAGATTLAATTLQASGTMQVGEEFTIQYHRSVYTISATAAISSSGCSLVFYPPLEANVSSTAWVINFRQSSLTPVDEDELANLAAARLSIDKSPKYFNVVVKGSGDVPGKFFDWGERRLGETLARLRANSKPKVKKQYPSE